MKSRGQRSACKHTSVALTTRGPLVKIHYSPQEMETPPSPHAGEGGPPPPQGLPQLSFPRPGAGGKPGGRSSKASRETGAAAAQEVSRGREGGLRPVTCNSSRKAFSFGLGDGNSSCWLQPRPVWTGAPVLGAPAQRRGLQVFGSILSALCVCVSRECTPCGRMESKPLPELDVETAVHGGPSPAAPPRRAPQCSCLSWQGYSEAKHRGTVYLGLPWLYKGL